MRTQPHHPSWQERDRRSIALRERVFVVLLATLITGYWIADAYDEASNPTDAVSHEKEASSQGALSGTTPEP